MVWFHTFWVQTNVTFFAFENGPSFTLLTFTIFYSPFTTTWFKLSRFILVPAIPEVLRDCAGRFLPYFPRISSASSHENFNNEILFPWILQNNLQAVIDVAFIDQSKKKQPPLVGANSHKISWHKLVKQINIFHICIILLERFWHWYVYMLFPSFRPVLCWRN